MLKLGGRDHFRSLVCGERDPRLIKGGRLGGQRHTQIVGRFSVTFPRR
jgi:hypothetical protein